MKDLKKFDLIADLDNIGFIGYKDNIVKYLENIQLHSISYENIAESLEELEQYSDYDLLHFKECAMDEKGFIIVQLQEIYK